MTVKVKKNIAISDTVFIFDPGTGDSYSLNPTGLEILKMLKNDMDHEAIIKKMLEKYDVDRTTVEMHLYDFITMLNHYQLADKDE